MDSKILLVLTAVSLVVMVLLFPTNVRISEAWNAETVPTPVPIGSGDSAYNYDFENDESVAQSNTDWPVNLLFWYDASVNKLYNLFWSEAFLDHEMKGRVNDGTGMVWDGDKGTKSLPDINLIHKHFRPYAANGQFMSNDSWGKYVVATSHLDGYANYGSPFWAGFSEDAEYQIGTIAQAMGLVVARSVYGFSNVEPYEEVPGGTWAHVWKNDGWVTLIKVFDFASHSTVGQELRATDSVVTVPIRVDSVNDRVTDAVIDKNIQSYQALAAYPYTAPSGQGPPKGTGMEMLYVGSGDAPFTTPLSDINNPSGITSFWQTVTSSGPRTIARLVPILIGSRLHDLFDLEVEYRSIWTPDGESIALKQEPITYAFRYLRGDANNSGAVDITDALFIAQYLAQLRDLDGKLNAASPIHDSTDQTPPEQKGDKITIQDALAIAQMLAGLRDDWYNPIESSGGTGLSSPSGVTVKMDLPQTGLTVGGTAAVPVTIKGIPARSAGVGAYDLRVTFDPKVIRVDRLESDAKGFARPAAVNIDNSKGIVYFNGFQTAVPGSTGDVTIASLVISAVGKPGENARLNVTVTTLSDSLGNPVKANVLPASLTLSEK